MPNPDLAGLIVGALLLAALIVWAMGKAEDAPPDTEADEPTDWERFSAQRKARVERAIQRAEECRAEEFRQTARQMRDEWDRRAA